MQTLRSLSPRSIALSGLALAAFAAAPAVHAQGITEYGSRAGFNAAASSLTTFTFNGYAPNGYDTYQDSSLTVNNVGFTGSALYVNTPADGTGNPFGGAQYLDADSGLITVALPAGTTAFGADFSTFNSCAATLTATVNGKAFSLKVPGGNSSASSFAGFTSSAPITSLSFSGNGYAPALDNVSYGQAVPAVPEPSAWASFAVGIAGLSLLGLRTRRRVAA